jgi:hypothetical protein
MSKTTRLPNTSKEKKKEKRYASRYAHGGLSTGVDVTVTSEAQNRPKIKRVAATGDKYNIYKTRIT